jgi:hypothetical protein
MKKKIKFTFKISKTTGSYSSFYPTYHYIKLNKKECGNIVESEPYSIRLMVYKDDIMEDGNGNCEGKWITLKKEFKTLQESKDFLNENAEEICNKFKLYFLEE